MSNETKQSVFTVLSKIDCSEHTEKIRGAGRDLTYLSWAWAWYYTKQNYPDSTYTIYENAEGRPYFDDGRTAWVKTGVTIGGIEHIEYLPIMDNRHNSIPLAKITSFDMNTAIQRSLTKAVARHGLGLYIYAGEDLPLPVTDGDAPAPAKKAPAKKAAPAPAVESKPAEEMIEFAGGSLPKRQFLKLVELAATDQLTKKGADPRDAFIKNCKPTPAQLDDFDAAIFDYQLNNPKTK